jgi:hypothetical protein
MTTRILPPDEWHRLTGTELGGVPLDPANAVVVVVEEDEDIVGRWAFLRVIHAEGFWIAPEHQKRVAVFRHLLREMQDVVVGFYGVHVA